MLDGHGGAGCARFARDALPAALARRLFALVIAPGGRRAATALGGSGNGSSDGHRAAAPTAAVSAAAASLPGSGGEAEGVTVESVGEALREASGVCGLTCLLSG